MSYFFKLKVSSNIECGKTYFSIITITFVVHIFLTFTLDSSNSLEMILINWELH